MEASGEGEREEKVSMIGTSSDLIIRLHSLGYDNPSRDPWWWPHSGRFETLIGAILTQNTTWKSVEISLDNLKQERLLEPEALANVPLERLEPLIRPSGYFRNKSYNLQQLSRNMLETFGSFEGFAVEVDRDWLMAQRGIGHETADAILNYACYREVMVVDSYTARLLEALDYPQSDYLHVQSWMLHGLSEGCREVFPDLPLAQGYARYHGMVVEYVKVNKHGKRVDVEPLQVMRDEEPK